MCPETCPAPPDLSTENLQRAVRYLDWWLLTAQASLGSCAADDIRLLMAMAGAVVDDAP